MLRTIGLVTMPSTEEMHTRTQQLINEQTTETASFIRSFLQFLDECRSPRNTMPAVIITILWIAEQADYEGPLDKTSRELLPLYTRLFNELFPDAGEFSFHQAMELAQIGVDEDEFAESLDK